MDIRHQLNVSQFTTHIHPYSCCLTLPLLLSISLVWFFSTVELVLSPSPFTAIQVSNTLGFVGSQISQHMHIVWIPEKLLHLKGFKLDACALSRLCAGCAPSPIE